MISRVAYRNYIAINACLTLGQCVESSFTCEKDKAQVGYDIAMSKTSSRKSCSHKCCENKECIGFDWVIEKQECWLSKTTRKEVALTDIKNIWSCEKKTIDTINDGESFLLTLINQYFCT